MDRVLIITDAWYPQVNGVTRACSSLRDELAKQGVETILIEPSLFHTIPLPFYSEIRIALFPKRKMRKLFRTSTADAVHIMTEGSLGLAGRSVCVANGIPFTTSYLTHFPLYLRIRGYPQPIVSISESFLRWFHTSGIRTMVATQSLHASLSEKRFTRLALWPLGVDTSLFKRTERLPALEIPSPVFAYCGRLAPEKNVDAFLKLPLPGKKLVIGDGPDRARLQAAYPDAEFVGYQHAQALVDWLSRSDVLVFPSRTDTFGLVMLEALSCGVPVAAYDVMGPQDIVTHGVNGYLGEDLYEAAINALQLSPDACRTTAMEYSWHHSANAFLANLERTKKLEREASI